MAFVITGDAATNRTNLGLGTAATLDVGSGANNIVQLDGSGNLPAIDGSALTGITTGKVLQVVQSVYSTQAAAGGNTFIDTGLSATITPSSTSSKVLILVNQPTQSQAAMNDARTYTLQLEDNTAGLALLIQTLSYEESDADSVYNKKPISLGNIAYLHSPASTAARTYKTFIKISDGSADIYAQFGGCPSTMTLMEIQG